MAMPASARARAINTSLLRANRGAWVAMAPEKLVWGSDWPHVTDQPHPPDSVALLDLLADWVDGDEALRRRILVDNPARLYGFA